VWDAACGILGDAADAEVVDEGTAPPPARRIIGPAAGTSIQNASTISAIKIGTLSPFMIDPASLLHDLQAAKKV
jgi:hypothetical protein